jgi:DNA primase
MARFNDAWMETLLTRSDIVSVVSSYVTLRAKGRNLWGLCPFHNEKTPSFSVSPDKQMYYCFGCGAGGGVVQFIMDMEHLPYAEAVSFLAQRAGIELPQNVDDEALQLERARKERLYAACKAAAQFFHDMLLSEAGVAARAYLARRGLDAGIVQRFGLGYAPDSWDALMGYLKAQSFREEELLDAGLLVKNARSGNVYDAYRNRVIFPIIGTNARVLGFGARTMGNDTPKYINTGDTPIYSKRRNLYALNMVKGAKISDIVMVEGYMDVISLHAAGITNAVASLGTALTQQQARLLKRYAPTVYVSYDGDAAGQNATLRGLDILTAEGLNVRVIVIPDGLDPDDYVRKYGKEAFDQLKDNALAFNAFKLMRMADGYILSTEDGRQEYALAGCRFIAGLQPVEQERYYAALARKTGMSVETLRAQGERVGSAPVGEERRKIVSDRQRRQQNASPRQRAELLLLRAMLHAPEAAQAVMGCDLGDVFSQEGYRSFAQGLIEAYARQAKPDTALLLSALTSEQAQQVAEAFDTEAAVVEPMQIARDCVKRIRLADIEETMQGLREQAASEQISVEEKLHLTRRIQEMDNVRRNLRAQ